MRLSKWIPFLVVSACVTACSLDPSSKPECLVDSDCRYNSAGHCFEQVCVANELPIGIPDVFYVPVGTSLDDLELVGDVTANDIDPEGRPLKIIAVNSVKQNDGFISYDGTTVSIKPKVVPSAFGYTLADDLSPTGYGASKATINVVSWRSTVTVPIEAGTSTSLASVLEPLGYARTEAIEVTAPPTSGTLVGVLPDLTYVPPADFCGDDSVTVRVQAANGEFSVVVTLAVGMVLADERIEVAFGAPVTVDVLANDRDGIELVSTGAAYATVASSKAELTIVPPYGTAGAYPITYTARDSRGCEGTATLTLDVGFPTSVLVGEGLTGDAFDAVLSHDGRFLTFTSADATLVANDTNAASDVFVRDLATNQTERISVTSTGAQANDGSSSPSLSADGRYVAFVSRATNLATSDTTAIEDVYLHDRTTGVTTLVSISVDDTGSDQPSLTPHISASGTHVAFASSATRLVSNDTNDAMDIFVRTVAASSTARVSVKSSGAEVPYASKPRPRISGNGRYVALSSTSSLDGSNTPGAFLIDTAGSAVIRIDASMGEVDVDDAGRFVIHADYQVSLIDRVVENNTVLGPGTFPSLSADGRYAAFVDGDRILTRNGLTNIDALVARDGVTKIKATPLRRPEISGDGRWIVFSTAEWPGYTGRFVIVRVWNPAFSG